MMVELKKYTCSLDLTAKIITSLFTALILVLLVFVCIRFSFIALILLGFLFLLWALLLSLKPTRYELSEYTIQIKTLIKTVKIRFEDVSEVKLIASLPKDSTRIFGNYGLFGYSGTFSVPPYDTVRFYCTKLSHIVLISLSNGTTIAISPNEYLPFLEQSNNIRSLSEK